MNDLSRFALSGVQFIRLLRGELAAVDAQDYDRVYGFPWRLMTVRRKKDGTVKARYVVYSAGNRSVYMHRLIMGAPSGAFVDHVDGDGLNNTRSNLRFATPQQNSCNRKTHANNRSGIKGVCWSANSGKWQANIRAAGTQHYLGLFDDKAAAAAAYAEASARLHGEFGRLG